MRASAVLGAVACALLSACPEPIPPAPVEAPFGSLFNLPPVAVGGVFQAYPQLECRLPDLQAPVRCRKHALVAVSAVADDESVVQVRGELVDETQGRVVVRALKPGNTVIRIVLQDDHGGTYPIDKTVAAMAIENVRLSPLCGPLASAPYLVPVSSRVRFRYEIASHGVPLAGDGVLPVDGGTFTLIGAGSNLAELKTPATLTRDVITSPVDPALAFELQTYDLPSVDSVWVDVATVQADGLTAGVTDPPTSFQAISLDYGVGGRRVCAHAGAVADGVTLSPWPSGFTYEVTAGGSCWLSADGGTSLETNRAQPDLYGSVEGACTVVAEVDGGTGHGTGAVFLASPIARETDPWSWDQPAPQGEDALAIGGTGPDDVWVTGEQGALQHFDGGSWKALPPGGLGRPRLPLHALRSAEDGTAWAGGASGVLLRWDGASWFWMTTPTAETITGIWTTPASEAWIVGTGGLVMHWDPSGLTRVETGTREDFTSIWGAGMQIWAASRSGVFRLSAQGLTRELSGGPAWLAGTGATDVWATGATTYHSDGGAWTAVDTGGVALRQVAAGAPDRAWAIGDTGVYGWDGQAWSLAFAQAGLKAIWAPGPDEAWAAGQGGTLARWDGTAWTDLRRGVALDGLRLTALDGTSAADLWAVGHVDGTGGGAVLQHTGPGWALATTSAVALDAVWSAGGGEVWAAGEGGEVLHRVGGVWTSVPKGSTKAIRSIWGSAANDVWFAGAGSLVMRWDGQGLSQTLVGACQPACGDSEHAVVWGTGKDDVWVAGSSNWSGWDVWHFQRGAWTSLAPVEIASRGQIRGIGGADALDVWFSTAGPEMLHWNGTSWFRSWTGYAGGSIWANSAWDVWSGNLHWGGTGWEIIETPVKLGPLWGTDATHVWTVTPNGSLMRRGP